MSLWNLLVVVCFAVLYMGMMLIFSQLRQLRGDLRAVEPGMDDDRISMVESEVMMDDPVPAPVMGMDPAVVMAEGREQTEIILEELAGVEDRILRTVEGLPEQIQSGLDALQKELRYLDRGMPSQHHHEPQSSNHSQGAKPDAYREAKLLLSNGVDEERVIEETGLTVEEVSLLKRLSGAQTSREIS
ncbi:hypothetical protein Mmc1_3036 [Magnetococcus marinus MC-1]|uniref:DUF2802 domain-containing protein n=1 Tax=Magnetococcus marinus (strain ATCC BAA-1437 / JCM 17883 / MC-1) TaxID=156889 RepID=A0LC34_MAGMM|nr:hypothetical protein [Magnetococcus marinus]ABK45527.1 hypothetical protein Mmc1_3036 [Magnetococcus marinus MC-1]